jgi:hypothetical protein
MKNQRAIFEEIQTSLSGVQDPVIELACNGSEPRSVEMRKLARP